MLSTTTMLNNFALKNLNILKQHTEADLLYDFHEIYLLHRVFCLLIQICWCIINRYTINPFLG